MPVMNHARRNRLGTDRRRCLCCNDVVKDGERYIIVGRVGIQHEDTCPRSKAKS